MGSKDWLELYSRHKPEQRNFKCLHFQRTWVDSNHNMRKHDQISLYLYSSLISVDSHLSHLRNYPVYFCPCWFFFFSPPPTNFLPFLVLIPARPSWFLLSLVGWSLLLKNGRRTQSLYLPWSSTNPLRSKHTETHEKHHSDAPLGPFFQSLYLKIGEFPAGKMTVESFTFLLSKVCEPGKVRNICSWFIYLLWTEGY